MKRNIITMAILLALFGCNSEKRNENADLTYADDLEKVAPTDSTLTTKVIKTADMRFRVKDVQNTKAELSQILKSEGGSVAEFSIQSSIQEHDKIKLSADSLKEITAYRTDGYLIAKVPSEKLDDFTNTIAKLAVFVDQQSMKMDDQSLTYLSNAVKAHNRVETVQEVKGIPTKKNAIAISSLNLKDEVVDRKVANLDINNRVKYSTITLNFYQDNTIQTRIIANDNVYDHKPAFLNRLWMNVLNGWSIFQEIILFVINMWTLILAGVAIYYGIRYYRMKQA